MTNSDFFYLSSNDPRVWSEIVFKVVMKDVSASLEIAEARGWLEGIIGAPYDDTQWKSLSGDRAALTKEEFIGVACSDPELKSPNTKKASLRRRVSLLCSDKPEITLDELLLEENKAGDITVTKEEIKDALQYVTAEKEAAGPMSRELVGKVHLELSRTRDYKDVFTSYDADKDGKVTAHDIFRVMTSQGEDITYELAVAQCAEIAGDKQPSAFGFIEFTNWMRRGDEAEEAEKKAAEESAE